MLDVCSESLLPSKLDPQFTSNFNTNLIFLIGWPLSLDSNNTSNKIEKTTVTNLTLTLSNRYPDAKITHVDERFTTKSAGGVGRDSEASMLILERGVRGGGGVMEEVEEWCERVMGNVECTQINDI